RQRLDTVAARVAGDDGVDGADVELVLALAVLERVNEPGVAHELGEIEVGAGEARHRDAVEDGRVPWIERSGPVTSDPLQLMLSQRRHVHQAASDRAQVMECRSIAVAE